MFRKHIDFLAVFFVAVVLAGFSKASSVALPPDADVLRLQNAVNAESCPLTRVLTQIQDILNR